MKKFVVLATICAVGACSWNKQGPIFPDQDEEIVQYEDGTVGVKATPVKVQEANSFDTNTAEAGNGEVYYQTPVAEYAVDAPEAFVSQVPVEGMTEEIVVDNFSPEVYAVLATRMANRIIDETTGIHEVRKTPTIYVNKVVKDNSELPNGTFHADKAMKNIFGGSKTYNVTGNVSEADYQLRSTVSSFVLNGAPAIQLKSELLNKSGEVVGEWTEVIQQIQNDDRSWW